MKKHLLLFVAMGMAFSVHAEAGRDITGYETIFVSHQRISSATTNLLKMTALDGKTSEFNLSVGRTTIGLQRERYDNKFAYFGLFHASGDGDKRSAINGKKGKLSEQLGIVYGSGAHVSDSVDWSIFIDASSGKVSVDGKEKSRVGVGIGTELAFMPTRHTSFGLFMTASFHYIGGGVNIKLMY